MEDEYTDEEEDFFKPGREVIKISLLFNGRTTKVWVPPPP